MTQLKLKMKLYCRNLSSKKKIPPKPKTLLIFSAYRTPESAQLRVKQRNPSKQTWVT